MNFTLVKTEYYIKFDKTENLLISDKLFTNYEIGNFFELDTDTNSYLDRYENEDSIYYRLYEEKLDYEEYHDNYTKTFYIDQIKINDEKTCTILPLSFRDATEEEIAHRKDVEWEVVRAKRNAYLEDSDRKSMIYLPDYWNQKSEEYKNSWLTYRQQLRDITNTTDNPFEIVWPQEPTI